MPRKPGPPREKTSISLTPEAIHLLEALTHKLGVNKSGILELSIRRMAEAEGVRSDDVPRT
jgi:hypothetical protein